VVADATGAAGGAWRSIDELALLVGAYCWVEDRIFELTGAWASAAGDGSAVEAESEAALEADRRVWCAAVSGHHGALAGRWGERLPVRAGVDRIALVAAPEGPLAGAMEALEAEANLGAGVAALVQTLLPRLNATYLTHLRAAAAVREAPVMEVLACAQRLLAGEMRSGHRLVEAYGAAPERGARIADLFEQAFEQSSIFPAVRPS
jgi:hypothetical protein